MSFPTTGPTTGLPAWPQASTPAPALPETAGDGFARAIDGALSLLAADAKPVVADGPIAPGTAAVAVPIQVLTTTPNVAGRTADPVLRPVALAVPPLLTPIADPNAVPDAEPAALPIAGKTQRDPEPLGAANDLAPTTPAERQEWLAHPNALDTAITGVPTRDLSTRDLPVRTKEVATTIAATPKPSLANPEPPVEPAALGATIAPAPNRPTPIHDPATHAAPIEPALAPDAPKAMIPDMPVPLPDAPSSSAVATKTLVRNIPAAPSAPSTHAVTPPAIGRAPAETLVAPGTVAALDVSEPKPATVVGATPPVAPASPAVEPRVAAAPPAPVARPFATEPRPPGTFDIATPTAPILAGTVKPAATATVEPVAANAERSAAHAALPGVLAAQTGPLMRVASPAAIASVAVQLADAQPTAPAPTQVPIPAAAPVSAIGAATLVRQATVAAPTLDPAPANAAPQPEDTGAVADQLAAKVPRAKPSATLPTLPDVAPATVVSAPEASAALPSRPESSERPVADPPSRPAPDEPAPAERPASAALTAPLLPQMVPISIPLPAAAAPAADTAKPTNVRRASALGTVTPGAQPAATRDTAQSTATADAPRFADALPASAVVGDAKPAIAPLLTAEPLRTASPQPIEPRAPAADAVPTPVVTAQPGQIGRDLGVEIARRVSAGGNELVVRLAPAELGRIEVRMSFDDRGGLTTVIAADSPVALDMLRRDSADLSRSLNDAGFRSDGQSLRFDGGGDRGDRSGGQPRSPWQNAGPKPGQPDDFGPGSDFETSPYRPLRTSGRYDLMA